MLASLVADIRARTMTSRAMRKPEGTRWASNAAEIRMMSIMAATLVAVARAPCPPRCAHDDEGAGPDVPRRRGLTLPPNPGRAAVAAYHRRRHRSEMIAPLHTEHIRRGGHLDVRAVGDPACLRPRRGAVPGRRALPGRGCRRRGQGTPGVRRPVFLRHRPGSASPAHCRRDRATAHQVAAAVDCHLVLPLRLTGDLLRRGCMARSLWRSGVVAPPGSVTPRRRNLRRAQVTDERMSDLAGFC
jgi:hypothetical protein